MKIFSGLSLDAFISFLYVTVVEIAIIVAIVIWLAILNRRFFYKNRLIKALPRAGSLSEYQEGVCEIKGALSHEDNDKYNDRFLTTKKKERLLLKILYYKIFNKRYFAYNQFPVVYISSYGNISEVSRRKFSTGDSIRVLQDLRKKMVKALEDNDVKSIIKNLADIYRVMYEVFPEEGRACVSTVFLKPHIIKIKEYIDDWDIVGAYIYWRSIEDSMKKMSDIEILIYGSLRLRLEKYIISYKCPLKSEIILKDISEFSYTLEALVEWMENNLYTKFGFIRRASLLFMVDMLGNGLKYQ